MCFYRTGDDCLAGGGGAVGMGGLDNGIRSTRRVPALFSGRGVACRPVSVIG